MKIANRDARRAVQNHRAFTASNLYGVTKHHQRTLIASDLSETPYYVVSRYYVVYSYGEHYPMFIYVDGQWFENEDNYSPTTSKHRTQAHPHEPTFPLSTQWMQVLAEQGYTALAKMRVVKGVVL